MSSEDQHFMMGLLICQFSQQSASTPLNPSDESKRTSPSIDSPPSPKGRKHTTLHFRISHTYGLIFFEKMVLRFLLIKYVWLIVFTVFSLKYGLLSGYELLGFWAIFMLRTLLLIVAELE